MIFLEEVLARLHVDLEALRLSWALIGGVAVSMRGEPRTTRDVDIAVAVADDRQAENVVLALRSRGYRDLSAGGVLAQTEARRLAGVRLLAPGADELGMIVDILFASSGIEPEIAAAADPLEVVPGAHLPVARIGHLMALKILAGRLQDLADCQDLLRVASTADLDEARRSLDLIASRGFGRGKDLQAELTRVAGSR